MSNPALMSVYEIFKSAFGEDVWDESIFRKVFNDCKCLIEDDGALIYREILGEVEILNIAVKKESQGQGIASELVKRLYLETPNARVYFLEVAVNNEPAIKLYQKHKFKIIGTREKYYTRKNGDVIDAYTMEYRIK